MIAFDIKPSPINTFEVELDGSTYLIQLVWGYKYSYWHMNISSSDGTRLLSGTKLVPDTDLTGIHTSNGLFPGHLEVQSLGDEEDIRFTSFEDRQFQLVYITKDEDFTARIVNTEDFRPIQLGGDVNEIGNLPIYDPDFESLIPPALDPSVYDCLPLGSYTIGSCEPFS